MVLSKGRLEVLDITSKNDSFDSLSPRTFYEANDRLGGIDTKLFTVKNTFGLRTIKGLLCDICYHKETCKAYPHVRLMEERVGERLYACRFFKDTPEEDIQSQVRNLLASWCDESNNKGAWEVFKGNGWIVRIALNPYGYMRYNVEKTGVSAMCRDAEIKEDGIHFTTGGLDGFSAEIVIGSPNMEEGNKG